MASPSAHPTSRRLLIGLALIVPGCTSAPTRVGPPDVSPRGEIEAVLPRLVEVHNDERAGAGLGPLEVDPRLEAAARRHALDMAARGRMSHRGGDGSSPFRRMEEEGYRYRRAAENVACGDFTLESLMRAWMSSPGHRRNILGPYIQVGASAATGRDGRTYWCVTFGDPLRPRGPSSGPSVGYP